MHTPVMFFNTLKMQDNVTLALEHDNNYARAVHAYPTAHGLAALASTLLPRSYVSIDLKTIPKSSETTTSKGETQDKI